MLTGKERKFIIMRTSLNESPSKGMVKVYPKKRKVGGELGMHQQINDDEK